MCHCWTERETMRKRKKKKFEIQITERRLKDLFEHMYAIYKCQPNANKFFRMRAMILCSPFKRKFFFSFLFTIQYSFLFGSVFFFCFATIRLSVDFGLDFGKMKADVTQPFFSFFYLWANSEYPLKMYALTRKK